MGDGWPSLSNACPRCHPLVRTWAPMLGDQAGKYDGWACCSCATLVHHRAALTTTTTTTTITTRPGPRRCCVLAEEITQIAGPLKHPAMPPSSS
ncbi:hypothetical protein GGTG_12769 [Gaeumannomyces tritici R3-111a-1]|uniref:Uncharacterized protein n=1 Tax=Gaeumannomyces tritici (strain R3-111a-1) TaxID=644352 RepID=J3PGY9_GAET3|nr:hypothetical protein GGTG_12769 [Gaeumannomyces tritici R3-111a-1]EJT69886.1 hypothetical protein GGTG_12769 [Gaeumannomyces tritici R3-111a-1]